VARAGRWRQVEGDGLAGRTRQAEGTENGEGEEAVAQVADGGRA